MPRTTVNIPEKYLKQARIEAAERNVPLQKVITEAMELKYGPYTPPKRKFKIITEDLGTTGSTYRREEIYEDILKHRTG